jgi:hypothetical protein
VTQAQERAATEKNYKDTDDKPKANSERLVGIDRKLKLDPAAKLGPCERHFTIIESYLAESAIYDLLIFKEKSLPSISMSAH